MAWKIEWDEHALKDLKKLDKQAQKDIVKYLKTRIATAESPRDFGKCLELAIGKMSISSIFK